MNPVPRQYLSTQPRARQATINFLTANVPNPFRGLLPGRDLNGATSSASSCCGRTRSSRTSRRAPTTDSSSYDSAQFRLEKRFSRGYTVLRELHLVASSRSGSRG